MAKTLLDAVNEILKRTNVIQGDAAALTSLTDSSHQHDIDIAIQVINEGMDEIYSLSAIPLPKEQAESTFTLVAGTQEYTLATDLIQLRWPLVDKTNSQFMFEFPGGYNQMLILDPEQDDTGLAPWAAISPVNGKLHLSHTPTSQEAGRTYTYQYDKDIGVSSATDTVPFADEVFRAMVPVWVQLWKREMRNEFDKSLYDLGMGRAARLLTEETQRMSYSPR